MYPMSLIPFNLRRESAAFTGSEVADCLHVLQLLRIFFWGFIPRKKF